MNKKSTASNSTLCIVIGIILIIISGFISYKNISKIQNHKNNGKKVKCTVTSVIQGRKGRQTVEAVYTDESGNQITASVIRNKHTYVGEEFMGSIVSEKPNDIYCIPSKTAQIIFFCILGAFGFLGIILIIYGIVSAMKKHPSV